MALVQKFIVEDAAKASSILPQRVALVNPDGTPVSMGGGSIAANSVDTAKIKDGAVTAAKLADDAKPKAATTSAPGIVKKASAVAAVASADIAGAAGANPTNEEYAKAVALANETKKQLNALLAALKAAGITD